MSKRDFYDVLGVSKDADEKTLKAAYRKLAMANHPDRNQGDAAAEERFREASEAYEVLKDPQKRAAYDRMGHAAFDQSAGGFGGGCPIRRSMIHAPRTTGDVAVPFEVIFRIAAWVSRPPYGLLSGSCTLRIVEPVSGVSW